jgi:hypothetical protein
MKTLYSLRNHESTDSLEQHIPQKPQGRQCPIAEYDDSHWTLTRTNTADALFSCVVLVRDCTSSQRFRPMMLCSNEPAHFIWNLLNPASDKTRIHLHDEMHALFQERKGKCMLNDQGSGEMKHSASHWGHYQKIGHGIIHCSNLWKLAVDWYAFICREMPH